MSKVCSSCVTYCADSANFCEECGSALPDLKWPRAELKRSVKLLFTPVDLSTAFHSLDGIGIDMGALYPDYMSPPDDEYQAFFDSKLTGELQDEISDNTMQLKQSAFDNRLSQLQSRPMQSPTPPQSASEPLREREHSVPQVQQSVQQAQRPQQQTQRPQQQAQRPQQQTQRPQQQAQRPQQQTQRPQQQTQRPQQQTQRPQQQTQRPQQQTQRPQQQTQRPQQQAQRPQQQAQRPQQQTQRPQQQAQRPQAQAMSPEERIRLIQQSIPGYRAQEDTSGRIQREIQQRENDRFEMNKMLLEQQKKTDSGDKRISFSLILFIAAVVVFFLPPIAIILTAAALVTSGTEVGIIDKEKRNKFVGIAISYFAFELLLAFILK